MIKHTIKVCGDLWGQSTIIEVIPSNCSQLKKGWSMTPMLKLGKILGENNELSIACKSLIDLLLFFVRTCLYKGFRTVFFIRI